jgi:tetratricopeptide (TPR) repeat protein
MRKRHFHPGAPGLALAAAAVLAAFASAFAAPASAEDAVDAANRLLQEKKYDEAIREADRLVAEGRHVAFGHNLRGLALYFLGRYAEAKASFLRSAELLGDDPETLRNARANAAMACTALSLGARERGDAAEALRESGEALRHDPGYGYGWYARGLALESASRPREAAEAHEKGDERMPADGNPSFRAGMLWTFLNEPERAEAALGRFLSRPGGRPADRAQALSWLGAAAWDRWDLPLARKRFREAREADPSRPEAAASLEEVEKAIEAMRRTTRAERRLAFASAGLLALWALAGFAGFRALRRRGLA